MARPARRDRRRLDNSYAILSPPVGVGHDRPNDNFRPILLRAIHHFVGYLANRKKSAAQRIRLNKYRKAQCIKYFILIVLLSMAAFPSIAATLSMAAFPSIGATLQTGLLDPITLASRSFNLLLLPIFDRPANVISVTVRFYEGAWLIMAIFLSAVLLNLASEPRHPSLLLPILVSPRRPLWCHLAFRHLADRPKTGPMHRLQIVRDILRRRLRASQQNPNCRVCTLFQLSRRLQG